MNSLRLNPGECPVTKYGNYALIFGALGYGVYKLATYGSSKKTSCEKPKKYVAEPSKFNE